MARRIRVVVGKALRLPIGTWIVAGLFTASGVLHLVNPEAFLWLMPPWLPAHIFLIYLSGVAELVSAIGLVMRQRWAPLFTVAVLLGVWPANWWYAFDVLSSNPEMALIAWLRLPLQLPLLWWAWKSPTRQQALSLSCKEEQ